MSILFLELNLILAFIFQGGEGETYSPECGQKMRSIEASSVWPWMVAILKSYNGTDYVLGTGALIDHRHVITAAVMDHNASLNQYETRISSVDYTRGEKYGIVRVRRHPHYLHPNFYNNIAILTLDRPVTDPDFNPVCLPNKEIRSLNLDNVKASLVGWGQNKEGVMVNILQQLKGMPVLPNRDCQQIFQEKVRNFQHQFSNGINNKMMCTEFPVERKGACLGAGGAPLMIEWKDTWYVVGILSFEFGCEYPGIPAGFTRVSEFSDWLREKTWS